MSVSQKQIKSSAISCSCDGAGLVHPFHAFDDYFIPVQVSFSFSFGQVCSALGVSGEDQHEIAYLLF